jgi:uncharacterized protein
MAKYSMIKCFRPLIFRFTFIVSLTTLFACAQAYATSQPAAGFQTPASLVHAVLKSEQDGLMLMADQRFLIQVATLARQLEQQQDLAELISNEQEIALRSMLNQHAQVQSLIAKQKQPLSYFHYQLYAQVQLLLAKQGQGLIKPNEQPMQKLSKQQSKKDSSSFERTLTQQVVALFAEMSDQALYQAAYPLGYSLELGQAYMLSMFQRYQKSATLTTTEALDFVRNVQLFHVYQMVLPIAHAEQLKVRAQRYLIEPYVRIKTPAGVTLSAVVVRKRGDSKKRPSAFQFTIYADESAHINNAIHAVAHGYVGVIVNTRGKRLSPDPIVPWEHDGKDATAAIDWISKQAWSDGRVAMYGGSYLGFTQWAAAKYMHPALKTIVPSAAANPLTGLPIENNIFLTGNYQWAFHVTNNNTLDYRVYADQDYWEQLNKRWFETGRAFRDIDKIDGTPNPWFQKWLTHPAFDSYYQAMLPYQSDYAHINIPVLTITGYFDGGQISAIDFLTRHYRYKPNADHSLLIGPYTHGSAQGKVGSFVGNVKLDPVAQDKDTEELTFAWFDHVLFNAAKPELIKDKVNYQLMGSNTWQHSASFAALSKNSLAYHLANLADADGHYRLTTNESTKLSSVTQTVDLADRTTQHNVQPWPLIQASLPDKNGVVFVTEPMSEDKQLAGRLTGHLSIAINKQDVDLGFNFYQQQANGEVFLLAHYRSRASYASDMGQRTLLIPGEKTKIPLVNGRMFAKVIERGSRLVLVLNVNKNQDAQVNMGTGKDVSDETIADAGEPLTIQWFSDSQINIPLSTWPN